MIYQNVFFKPILLIVFIYNIHYCTAQTEKIKISEIINSIYFSKEGLDIKNDDKMFFL
jgi:hypothetical protein